MRIMHKDILIQLIYVVLVCYAYACLFNASVTIPNTQWQSLIPRIFNQLVTGYCSTSIPPQSEFLEGTNCQLSPDNFQTILSFMGVDMNANDKKILMKLLDTNGNGLISWKEMTRNENGKKEDWMLIVYIWNWRNFKRDNGLREYNATRLIKPIIVLVEMLSEMSEYQPTQKNVHPDQHEGLRKRIKIEIPQELKNTTLGNNLYSWIFSHPLTILAQKYAKPIVTRVQDKVAEFITEQRGIFVVIFLLPISFVFDILWGISQFFILHGLRSNSIASHKRRVKRIQESIKKARKNGHNKLCTARPGWLAMSFRQGIYKQSWAKIDLNDLNNVLNVDTENQIVRCEPLCSMGQLSHALSKKGWSLAVTPELDDLTVGGLIMGFGIETSSHKYGLFQNICKAFDIVLPDGTLVRCSAEINSDLFYAIPWSHGTIGFLVSADIEIVRCKPLVQITYHPFHTRMEYVEAFSKFSNEKEKFDFVECLAYSRETGVVMTGKMVNYDELLKNPLSYNQIGLWYKPWFYQHVEKFLKKNSESVELIPLRDYYHRHTRSIFWELKEIIPFGDHWLFRICLGWLMPVRVSLLKLTQTEQIRQLYGEKHVTQDMLMPIEKLEESLEYMESQFNYYPLWLCPMLLPAVPKNSNASEALVHVKAKSCDADSDMISEQMYVDIGIYGAPRIPDYNAKVALANVESFVLANGGFQALYADSLLSLEDFRRMFDHRLYDKVRAKYNIDDSFPIIYDKVSLTARR